MEHKHAIKNLHSNIVTDWESDLLFQKLNFSWLQLEDRDLT